MRIAHIICEMGMGGAQTMLVDIVNVQVETEAVAVLVVNDIIDKRILNRIDHRCTVKLINRKRGSRSLLPWIRLNVFLFKYKPDIIHFHLEGMRKTVFYPAPKVFTIHNIHTSGKEYPKFQALYAISDGVKHYTEQQGFEATTVWNGINTSLIKVKSGSQYTPGDQCRIVCVGRLFTQHKGQDILVRALGDVKKRGFEYFHLDLIGDGESRDELERLVSDCDLNHQVSFLGQRDRVYIYDHLQDYDLFVLPSRSEGFGLTVAEAMCAKVPVVVCDLEGAANVIDGGRLGLLFKTADSHSLAAQIVSFIQKGADEGLVEDAYIYAKDNFDISQTAKRYIEEYKKVIKK